MLPPNEPIGTSSLAAWCRRLLRYCRSIAIQPGRGYRVSETGGGTVLELDAFSSSGKPTKRYLADSLQGDYIVAHTWDGTTEDTLTEIYIAKAPHLRHSLTVQTIAGAAVTLGPYTVSGGTCQRLAVGASATQVEMVIPVWQLGNGQDSELFATEPSGGTGITTTAGASATLLDINVDARAWCQTDT